MAVSNMDKKKGNNSKVGRWKELCLRFRVECGRIRGLVWITWLRIPHVAAVMVLPLEEVEGRHIWKLAGHPFLSVYVIWGPLNVVSTARLIWASLQHGSLRVVGMLS